VVVGIQPFKQLRDEPLCIKISFLKIINFIDMKNFLFLSLFLAAGIFSCEQAQIADPAIAIGQTNAEMTRKVHDLFSKNQFDECVKFAAPNVQVVAHSIGMTFNGHTEFRNFMAGFKQSFPDMVITHNNSIALGDKVAVEFTATGTHTGPLQTPNGEIPASGKKVEIKVCEFWEWKNGKITKITNYQDASSLMRQIASTQ
jgi:steroid delta-isomerase-like uncharacterized protein